MASPGNYQWWTSLQVFDSLALVGIVTYAWHHWDNTSGGHRSIPKYFKKLIFFQNSALLPALQQYYYDEVIFVMLCIFLQVYLLFYTCIFHTWIFIHAIFTHFFNYAISTYVIFYPCCFYTCKFLPVYSWIIVRKINLKLDNVKK